jgi:hypothetical protein
MTTDPLDDLAPKSSRSTPRKPGRPKGAKDKKPRKRRSDRRRPPTRHELAKAKPLTTLQKRFAALFASGTMTIIDCMRAARDGEEVSDKVLTAQGTRWLRDPAIRAEIERQTELGSISARAIGHRARFKLWEMLNADTIRHQDLLRAINLGLRLDGSLAGGEDNAGKAGPQVAIQILQQIRTGETEALDPAALDDRIQQLLQQTAQTNVTARLARDAQDADTR